MVLYDPNNSDNRFYSLTIPISEVNDGSVFALSEGSIFPLSINRHIVPLLNYCSTTCCKDGIVTGGDISVPCGNISDGVRLGSSPRSKIESKF